MENIKLIRNDLIDFAGGLYITSKAPIERGLRISDYTLRETEKTELFFK